MSGKHVQLVAVMAVFAAAGGCSDTASERPIDAPSSADGSDVADARSDAAANADAATGIAVALQNRRVPTYTEIDLFANASDPLGRPLVYAWTVMSAPVGSAAVLYGPNGPVAGFVPDAEGEYVIALTVSAGADSATATMTLTATNAPPQLTDLPPQVTYTGTAIDVTAVATDPNGDPIVSTRWRLKGSPEGSNATVSSSSLSVSFVPDVDGPYLLEVVASDGRDDSEPLDVSVMSFHPLAPLAHHVIAAETSKSLARIVTIDGAAASLYIYDPTAKSEVTVALSALPTSLSVSPDGHFAAVGHDGSASYVDLVHAEVVEVYPLTASVFNLVLAGNGYVYLFPATATNVFPQLHILNLATAVESESEVNSLLYEFPSVGRLHPDGNRIYVADIGISPSTVLDYDITSPDHPTSREGLALGSYFFCDDIWLTEDGTRVLTACGLLFQASANAATDMSAAGDLMGFAGLEIQSASDSKAAGKLVVVGKADPFDAPDADEFIWIFGDQIFEPRERFQFGDFIVTGQAYPARGRFVFVDPDGAHYHVLVQADPSAGLAQDWAVATYAF